MNVPHVEDVWTDPADDYTVRVVRSPSKILSEDDGRPLGMSRHTGELWCETPSQEHSGELPRRVHIGPLVKTHTQFSPALIERGYGPDTHYLLGRRRGGYPLRIGSKPAVEALLAELKSEWREYRRASDPEYRIEGLRAIRRARETNDSERLAELEKRYPKAADFDRHERPHRRLASSVLGSIRAAPKKSSQAVQAAADRFTTGSRRAIDSTRSLAGGLLASTQGLLASALSTDLNALLQSTVEGSATIYDKALDATYLATHIGGGNHRLFDGGHTVAGAIAAVRE